MLPMGHDHANIMTRRPFSLNEPLVRLVTGRAGAVVGPDQSYQCGQRASKPVYAWEGVR